MTYSKEKILISTIILSIIVVYIIGGVAFLLKGDVEFFIMLAMIAPSIFILLWINTLDYIDFEKNLNRIFNKIEKKINMLEKMVKTG
ncbi:hypothetical protein [Caldisphaera sp.]|uniref:hypothetical protein n=1 Tax=Caldisphaera sp. TaxID=2060322 RepID=UPI0025C13B71|nr:hypothetical protein [Caldisphaera sp.]